MFAGQQCVHGGHHKNGQQCAQAHATHNHPADLLPAFGAGAGGNGQRQRAQHHGAGGHQNRAQALRGRLPDRIRHRHATLAQLVGKLHNQNAVFGDQAHQRDQANLAEHIERAAGQPQRQQRAGHRQRHAQQNDEGVNKAFKLRSQHQKNEQQRQHKHNGQRARRIAELAADAVQVGGVASLQHFLCGGVHECQRLAQRIVGCQVGGDGRRAALAKVVQLTRHHHLIELDQGRQRRDGLHPALAAAHKNLLNRIGCSSAAGIGLHHHVVLLTFAFVAGHQPAAQRGFYRARHGLNAHTQVGGALAVHRHADLGFVQAQVGVDLQKAGVFGHFGLHLAHRFGQVLVAVGRDDDKVDGPLAKALAQRRRRDRKGRDTRQARNTRCHVARHVQRTAATLFPGLGTHDHAALRHRGVAHHREDPVKLGIVAGNGLNLVHIAVGVVQRGAIGAVDDVQHHTPVFQRCEFAFDVGQQQRGTGAAGHHDRHHQPAVPQGPAQQAAVGIGQCHQPALHPAVKAAGLRVVTQQLGAHHGRQRQRNKARDHHRSRQRQRKLGEQPAGAAGGKRQRRIHRGQRERHGHHCKAHLAGTGNGGLERR